MNTEDSAETSQPSCCTPTRCAYRSATEAPGHDAALQDGWAASSPATGEERHRLEQCHVPAQTFAMGDPLAEGYRHDGEGYVHEVTLPDFCIDATTVTNTDFAAFVEDTGYRSEAETYGFSAVFYLAIDAPGTDVMSQASGAGWWRGVTGADWRHPGGRNSSIDELGDHPVVHISFNDAQAYCRWAGRRLPTEAEWECAARGGLVGQRFPWGNELRSGLGGWRCNIWQGTFPTHNTGEDGWLTTAPVRSFQPNGYGLWQAVGNVWEWCADYFHPRAYLHHEGHDPSGPGTGEARVLRGGSYLCHASYCYRYRNAARSSNTPDSSMGNAGFRTVAL